MSEKSLQLKVVAALCIVVTGLVAVLYFSDRHLFQRFMGDINPLLIFVVTGLLGVALLTLLLYRGWFVIYKKENLRTLPRSCALAALLGLVMILVDTQARLPADMNIPFPQSLLFYPAMGFLAQILFHVLPLTLLLFALTALFRNVEREKIAWACLLAVALLEPVYQAMWSASNQLPSWAAAYVVLHVFLINLCELLIFKRYDFVSMYAFRLAYYLIWHIGWGHARLTILF